MSSAKRPGGRRGSLPVIPSKHIASDKSLKKSGSDCELGRDGESNSNSDINRPVLCRKNSNSSKTNGVSNNKQIVPKITVTSISSTTPKHSSGIPNKSTKSSSTSTPRRGSLAIPETPRSRGSGTPPAQNPPKTGRRHSIASPSISREVSSILKKRDHVSPVVYDDFENSAFLANLSQGSLSRKQRSFDDVRNSSKESLPEGSDAFQKTMEEMKAEMNSDESEESGEEEILKQSKSTRRRGSLAYSIELPDNVKTPQPNSSSRRIRFSDEVKVAS